MRPFWRGCSSRIQEDEYLRMAARGHMLCLCTNVVPGVDEAVSVNGARIPPSPLPPRPSSYRMNKMRSIFKPTKAETTRSQGATTNVNNTMITSSTINSPRGDQYITNVYTNPPTPLASAFDAPVQSPFNDAPVDNLSTHFTGRKRELALIAKAFEKRCEIPLLCALHGNQGVGKSQLTYSWAKSTFARKENAYIMWISATTVEKLFQGFCRLLRFVHHPDQSHPDQNARLEAARRWLEEVNTGNWLLVFDNVFPETVNFLRQHLPRVNSRGTILFTTRTRDVAIAITSSAGEQHEVIEVPLLNVDEGAELFCGHFESGKVDPSSPTVRAIVKAVGGLPLAISHAAAYMNQSRISLDALLELYQGEHKIHAIAWEHTLSDYEHKSVASTFTSQLQDLDQRCPDASKLLRVIAFFDPESIPLEMLATGAKAMIEKQGPRTQSSLIASLLELIQSPISRQNVITQLQARCLVSYHANPESPTFRIHDLIQLVVLANTKSSGMNVELFDFAVELACAAFWKIEDPRLPEWWPQCELLVPHIQSLTLRQDTSTTAKKYLLLANMRQGLYLSSLGRYVEAESLLEQIRPDMEQLFGPNDLNTFTMMDNLAFVYQCRGRYVDAEMLLKRVLDSEKSRLGPKHRNTLNTMVNLSVVYIHQHRYDDTEALLKQTFQSQESQFGSEDRDTLRTTILLAEGYRLKKRYDEAESLFTRVLHARERMLSSEHSSTLIAKFSLANLYFSQQRHDAAALLFQQVLLAQERGLGSQHPDTLITMHHLACVYASQNRDAEAEKLLVHALAGQEKVYGFFHPYTQSTAKELLSVYEELGRVDEVRILKQRISTSS